MRHRAKSVKLQRTSQHRDSMLANMVSSLILHNRIKTTLPKAKAAKPLAEKMITLGKKGDLHARRLAVAALGEQAVVKLLFAKVAPRFKDRKGGYTRIIKIGPRKTDAAPMALLEWTELEADETVEVAAGTEAAVENTEASKAKKPAKSKAPKKAETEESSE